MEVEGGVLSLSRSAKLSEEILPTIVLYPLYLISKKVSTLDIASHVICTGMEM